METSNPQKGVQPLRREECRSVHDAGGLLVLMSACGHQGHQSAVTLAAAASFPLLTGRKEWNFVELLTSQPVDLQGPGQELWI